MQTQEPLPVHSVETSHSETRPLGSFRLLMAAFAEASRIYSSVLRTAWIPLVSLHVLQAATDQYFQFTAEIIRNRGQEDILLIGVTALLELLVNLLWSTLWVLIISQNAHAWLCQKPPAPFWDQVKTHLNPLLIEQVRSIAAILWRLPFLFLPALIEYIRLSLVPYVVLFDLEYANGQKDALRQSRQLTRGRWVLLSLIVAGGLLLPWFAKQMILGGDSSWIWRNPGRVSLAAAVAFFINTFSGLLFFFIYRHLAQMSEIKAK